MGLFQFSGQPAGQVTSTGNKRVGAPLAAPAFGMLASTLGGDYLHGGQGFDAAQQAAYNQITPQVQSAFSQAGRLNSGLARTAQTQALGDSFAGLYNNERNRQLQAAQIAPSLTQDVSSSEPYFENDLATLAGLLGVGGSLLGGGDGGLLGSLASGGKSLYDTLFGGASTVANGLGSGVLGFGGAPGFADALNGPGIDASSGFAVNNAGGPGLGGGSSGPGLGGVPTPPTGAFDALSGGSLSGPSPAVLGDLNLGGLGAGAFGVANGLGANALGFGGASGFVPAGVSVGSGGVAAGGLNLSGVANGLVNTGVQTGLSAGSAPASSFGGLSSGTLGFAAPAAIAAVAASQFAGKAATRKKAIGVRDAFANSLKNAPVGPSGGNVVDVPGIGQQEIMGGGPDYEFNDAGFVFRTADGGQISFVNGKPEFRPAALVKEVANNLAAQHAYGRSQGYVEGSNKNAVTRTGRASGGR